MLYVGIDQYGQRRGHADAAVRAEGRPFGPDPFAVDAGADGVVFEIELHVGIFLAHHVHVRLQNDGRMCFESGGGGLAHHDVTDGVFLVFEAVLLGESDEVFDDASLFFRRTGHLRNGIEQLPHEAWIQRGDC